MTTNAPPSRNPANDDTLVGAFELVIRKLKQNWHDMLPCVVVSHDRGSNRVSVRPIIRVIDTEDRQIQRDVIASVPVLNLGSGGFLVNFNITAGSLGWIKASDRDISLFLQSYKEEAPNSERMHRFSDGLFIPDVMTGYDIASEDGAAMVIQNLDGSVKIALDDSQIRVINDSVRLEIDKDSVSGVAPGGFNFNGATIGPNGEIESPVSVTSPSVVADGNELAGHDHPAGTPPGNTGPNNP